MLAGVPTLVQFSRLLRSPLLGSPLHPQMPLSVLCLADCSSQPAHPTLYNVLPVPVSSARPTRVPCMHAGLVLGLSMSQMFGQPISAFLPLDGRSTTDLVEGRQVGVSGERLGALCFYR